MQYAEQPSHFLFTHELEGADPLRAEQLGHAYFPRLAPVWTVGGEGDIGAAEGEVPSGNELGAVCKDVIMGLENEPRKSR